MKTGKLFYDYLSEMIKKSGYYSETDYFKENHVMEFEAGEYLLIRLASIKDNIYSLSFIKNPYGEATIFAYFEMEIDYKNKITEALSFRDDENKVYIDLSLLDDVALKDAYHQLACEKLKRAMEKN